MSKKTQPIELQPSIRHVNRVVDNMSVAIHFTQHESRKTRAIGGTRAVAD